MAAVQKVGTEFLVNTETGGNQLNASIFSLLNGGFVVTWTDESSGTLGDASSYSIKAQVFGADGLKVGGEFLVNTQTLNEQYNAMITGLANGGFVVTWQDYSGTLGDNSQLSIKAQVFTADGTRVGAEFLVNTETSGNQLDPTVTGLADGGFVIAWSDLTGTLGDSEGYSIKAQVFKADGTKVGSEFLVNTETVLSQQHAAITGLANGGFVATWTDESGTLGDSNGNSIKAQVFDADGTKVGSEFLVNTETANFQTGPAITSLSNGGFVVTWQDGDFFQRGSGTLGDNDGCSVKAQVFKADGSKVGCEFLVSTHTAGRQSYPTISSITNGGFVATWTDESGTLGDSNEFSIKAQVFDADGTKVGSEFLVNTETIGLQWRSAITGLANGGFAVTWEDYSKTLGDTSAASIKAQVFGIGEAPTITSNGSGDTAALSIAENTRTVTKVAASDADAGSTLSYSISGGADAAKFQIDSATGALSFKTAPNFEAPGDVGGNNVYDVTVQVSDGSLTDTQALAVTVTNVNEKPTGSVTVTGSTVAGSTLTASNTVKDPDGAGAGRYQWTRDGVDIAGATKSTYVTTADDAGHAIAATLRYTDGGGFAEKVVSASQTIAGGTPGVTIAGSDLQTGEDGSTATFSIVLTKAPVDPVTLHFAVSDATEGSLQTDTLTFTIANWNVAQTLTVTGVDDYLNDGPQAYALQTTVDTRDLSYLRLTVADVALSNLDDGQDTPRYLYGDNEINYLTGGNGDDRIYGAGNMDELRGGIGNDRLYGEQDNDRLYGGDGQDQLYGGYDDDELHGDAGNDKLYGEAGNDQLDGGAGNDVIDGGIGADTMTGGAGNDTYYVDDTGDVIDDQGLASDVDTVLVFATIQYTLAPNIENASLNKDSGDSGLTGNGLANDLTGNDGRNTLAGGAGNDTIDGGAGNDTVNGGTGNDVLIGGAGNDTITGGTGTDTVDLTDAQGNVSVDLVANQATGDGTDTLSGIENVVVGGGNDTVTGSAVANTLEGGAGNDRLDGRAGNDVLVGGAGNDTITGGTGTDTVDLTDAQGNVSVDLGTNRATGDGTDTLSGIENVVVGGGNGTVTGSADANTLDGGAGNDSLTGGGGNDVLVGGTGNDTLYAGDGNDTVSAGAGNDLIVGGNGAGNDSYNGGTGVDTIRYTSARAGIRVDLSAAKDQAASIAAGDAAGIGTDQLSGIENVIAGKYADRITGNAAANQLWGNGGNDTLSGGAGNDKLAGGAGKDTLTGGTGKDVFLFDTAPASRDTITDFSRADGDRIQLSKAVFAGLGYTGTLRADDFYAAAGATSAHDATDRLVYNTTTGILYYDADGLGGSAAVQIALLGAATHPALAFSDIQIVA